jgi:DNA-binding transcriptional MocR family regulator
VTRAPKQHSLRWRYEKAVRDSDLPASAKSIAWALKSRADEFGWCNPSLPTLAHDAGLSRSTVALHLRVLQAQGWLWRGSGGGHASTRYQITLPPAVRELDGCPPADGRLPSGTGTAAVRLVDASRPAAGPEEDQEADQLEQFKQEEQEARLVRSVGAPLVRAAITRSLGEGQ